MWEGDPGPVLSGVRHTLLVLLPIQGTAFRLDVGGGRHLEAQTGMTPGKPGPEAKGTKGRAQPPLSEKERATHSRILAWRIPGIEEPGGLLSMESHAVGHD